MTKTSLRSDILLYRNSQNQPQAVLLQAGQAVEWFAPLPESDVAVKDIYLGQIASVDRGLQRVFVDIGWTENGFLPLKEVQNQAKEGQPLVVQIRRLAHSADEKFAYDVTKGPLLTTKLQWAGPFVVYEPDWKENGRSIHFLRSKSKTLDHDVRELLVSRDLSELQKQAQSVADDAAQPGPIPRRLCRLYDPVSRALNDWTGLDLQSIQAQDLELFELADHWLKQAWPALLPLLKLSTGSYSLAEVHRIADLEREIKRRKIHLKNGGSLVLDQAEALLAIDVNSGKAQGSDPLKLRLQTNLQAATEIARQLRLRNISGLIVVDFIRLKDEADQLQLEAAFAQELARDPAKMTIGGFTRLGLYELIRQTR